MNRGFLMAMAVVVGIVMFAVPGAQATSALTEAVDDECGLTYGQCVRDCSVKGQAAEDACDPGKNSYSKCSDRATQRENECRQFCESQLHVCRGR